MEATFFVFWHRRGLNNGRGLFFESGLFTTRSLFDGALPGYRMHSRNRHSRSWSDSETVTLSNYVPESNLQGNRTGFTSSASSSHSITPSLIGSLVSISYLFDQIMRMSPRVNTSSILQLYAQSGPNRICDSNRRSRFRTILGRSSIADARSFLND